MQKSLLIGCGNSRQKKVYLGDNSQWGDLTTIDINPDCGATIVMDVGEAFREKKGPADLGPLLPFDDETFDELAAYDVLEHWGQQGDWRGWFKEMGEYHRILKPGGTFGIIVPIGADALADPGHTRFFSLNYFSFLDQAFYADMLARSLPVTDYRWFWKKSFETIWNQQVGNHHLAVILKKSLST